MDLKLHFVLLRRPIYVAIHRVLWAHFCLALSTVWPPQQSQGVSVLGCWHFPLPNLSTHSVVNGQLADYGRMEHRVTLSTGFKEDKHVEGWRCVMHHSGVKHTRVWHKLHLQGKFTAGSEWGPGLHRLLNMAMKRYQWWNSSNLT